jgi:hypothetical protein
VTTVGQEAIQSFGELSGKKSRQPIDGSSKEQMFVDKLSEMLPFLAIGALGVADLVAAIGILRARAGLKSSERGASSYCAIRTTGSTCCASSAGCW